MSPSTVERINVIATKLRAIQSAIVTEEATTNALVMPFISQVLGYDVFDPSEVTPEFVTDVGTKKGEKIDYAIRKDGEIQILLECKKHWAMMRVALPLPRRQAHQLHSDETAARPQPATIPAPTTPLRWTVGRRR